MIVDKQVIREFGGKIIGYIETDKSGDKVIRDFYGRILGRYDKRQNVTRDFYGRIVANGDQSALLIGMHKK